MCALPNCLDGRAIEKTLTTFFGFGIEYVSPFC